MKIKRFLFQWVAVCCLMFITGSSSAEDNGYFYDNCESDDPLCKNPDTHDEESIADGTSPLEGEGEIPSFRYQQIDDYDDDGVINSRDNCPKVPNSAGEGETQKDYDGDGVGDPCDNCTNTFNPAIQWDMDGDRIGDACDRDLDGDFVLNSIDGDKPDDSVDTDGEEDTESEDTEEDTEDPLDGGIDGGVNDRDGGIRDRSNPAGRDGAINYYDNCALHYNPGQEDLDEDGLGDACDDDIDGDGTTNSWDPCPFSALLVDGSQSAECLGDTDLDSVPNFALLTGSERGGDNCPETANLGQEDRDGDGLGDDCDPDIDGDTVQNSQDNCFWKPGEERYGLSVSSFQDVSNPDQEDRDRDGRGDVCDDKFCFVVPSLASRVSIEDENGDVDLNDLSESEREEIRQKLALEAAQPDTNLDLDRASEPRFCLNPSSPEFVVETPHVLGVEAGDEVLLRLFANRVNAPLRYKWSIAVMPIFEAGKIKNAVGATGYSTPFEYNYDSEATPVLVPKEPGYYSVRVEVRQAFPDPITGRVETAEAFATIYVSGNSLLPVGECNCRHIGRRTRPARERGLTFLLAQLFLS